MSDKKAHATIATYVIPTGTKVVNESGEEVGEIVQWSPASDGRVSLGEVPPERDGYISTEGGRAAVEAAADQNQAAGRDGLVRHQPSGRPPTEGRVQVPVGRGVQLGGIEKYPGHKPLIDFVKQEALKRWPAATFRLDLFTDPEGSHITWEPQHLTLMISTRVPYTEADDIFDIEGEEPRTPYGDALHEWADWICSNAFQKVRSEHIGDLTFLTNLLPGETE